MGSGVLVERHGAVMRIAFDRPDKKNAITTEMYAAAADALLAADLDPAIGAVVIGSTGETFTAGNDLRDFLERPPAESSAPVLRFLDALASTRKPLVAAVRGAAVGIGTTLLLHCDLVYAAEDARFWMPFVDLGLVPEAGSSLLVPQRVGPHIAAEFLLLGEPFGAERARALGLVNEIVPGAELDGLALGKAHALAAKPREAMLATRALLRGANAGSVRERIAVEAERFVQRLASPEARAAMAAFLSRRA